MGNIVIGQTISPQVVTTTGATMANGITTINFTVGEITVSTLSDGNNTIGQGFTSSSTHTTITTVVSPDSDLLNVSVYPNPVTEIIFVDVRGESLENFRLVVHSIDGALLLQDNFIAKDNHIGINTQKWAKGTYVLSLLDSENQLLCSYQLIKTE
jgi:hypothetical protein